jgi:hypothetical protein
MFLAWVPPLWDRRCGRSRCCLSVPRPRQPTGHDPARLSRRRAANWTVDHQGRFHTSLLVRREHPDDETSAPGAKLLMSAAKLS